jgi:anti-anti-sigma factor
VAVWQPLARSDDDDLRPHGLVRSTGTSIGRTLSVTRHAHPPAGGEHSAVRLPRPVAVADTAPAQLRLAVSISAESGTIQVRAAGELDMATGPQLGSHLAALTGDGGTIDLDLGHVTFIDLAGLRAILEARRDAQARDQDLRIAVPGQACARLLELTRTTELLSSSRSWCRDV